MHTRLHWGFRSGGIGVGLLVLGLVLCLGATAAHGQADGDTTAVDTLRTNEPPPSPAPLDSVRADDTGPAEAEQATRATVTADSLSAMTRDGERLQELFDNVVVRQDTTRLRSNYGLRYLNRNELLFTGEVVIYERGDTLRADTVRYNTRTKVGRARGNVRLTDGEVRVRAPRADYYTQEKRSVFTDSVTLVDSSRVLRAQGGTYWSNERRAEFEDNVELTDTASYLSADSLTYFRDQERSIATGNVFSRRVETGPDTTSVSAADTTAITYLFGEWADNQEQNRYSRVEGEALLVRVAMDSTGVPNDTLLVRGGRLEARRTDTYRRLVAVDSVRIWQSDLAATADSAVYDRVVARGAPDTTAPPARDRPADGPPVAASTGPSGLDSLVAALEPVPLRGAETSTAQGTGRPPDRSPASPEPTGLRRSAEAPRPADTSGRGPVDTARASPEAPPPRAERSAPDTSEGGGAPQGPSWDRPSVPPDGTLPLEETRLFRAPDTWFETAQVWGDSIRVRARSRRLDTVYVRGAAFAAQRDTTLGRIQQLKAKDITALFRDGTLHQLQARPNAQAIRFLKTSDGQLNGAARVSGDRIALRFRDGSVHRTSVISGVESTYYRTEDDIPSPFRLEGFRWTPDRKPTRATLLRDERVQRRLGVEVSPAADPPPPDDETVVDSVAQGPDRPAPEQRDRTGSGAGRPDSGQRPPSAPAHDTTESTNPIP